MDDRIHPLINKTHWNNGVNGLRTLEKEIRVLFSQYKLPEVGWRDEEIIYLCSKMSLLDTNNHRRYLGVGEREGRTCNEILRRRCFGMTHGIGRSGDILADQPKAAGSSMTYKLVNKLVLDCIRTECRLKGVKNALIVPMCTGMALAHVFLCLRSFSGCQNKKYVILSQIDQQTCLKSVIYAGLHPIIVPLIAATVNEAVCTRKNRTNDLFLQTDIECMRDTVRSLGKDSILCIVSTTSCFSPRLPDNVEFVSTLCRDNNIAHVVNHAYGLQSRHMAARLSKIMSCELSRIDFIICSTDKNFLVPVGGSVISSPVPDLISQCGKIYPGRASAAPIQDLLISLLSLGRSGMRDLYSSREKCLDLLREKLQEFAMEKKEVFMSHPSNDISLSMSLCGLSSNTNRIKLGAEIFSLGVSGARVVVFDGKKKLIGGFCFESYGSHQSTYTTSMYDIPSEVMARMHENFRNLQKVPYLTVACSIGMKEHEVEKFISKLRIVYEKLRKKSI